MYLKEIFPFLLFPLSLRGVGVGLDRKTKETEKPDRAKASSVFGWYPHWSKPSFLLVLGGGGICSLSLKLLATACSGAIPKEEHYLPCGFYVDTRVQFLGSVGLGSTQYLKIV